MRRARVPLARGPHGEGALRRLVAHRGAGLRAEGPPARQAQPADPAAHPARRCGRRRPRSRRTRAQPAPACVRSSASRRDHGRRARSADAAGARTSARRRAPAARPTARAARRARRRESPPRPATSGATATLLALVTVFALVSAVVFHVVLAQNQLQLDRLNAQIAKEQRTYEQRRLTASLLASPQRIIQEAERLGLVVPADPPQYLYVDRRAAARRPTTARPPTPSPNWSKAKPSLGPQQP